MILNIARIPIKTKFLKTNFKVITLLIFAAFIKSLYFLSDVDWTNDL